jgi:hypothetical protein
MIENTSRTEALRRGSRSDISEACLEADLPFVCDISADLLAALTAASRTPNFGSLFFQLGEAIRENSDTRSYFGSLYAGLEFQIEAGEAIINAAAILDVYGDSVVLYLQTAEEYAVYCQRALDAKRAAAE